MINFKKNNSYYWNQIVNINWNSYETSELWNFFVWLNWYRTWLSLKEVYSYWMSVEIKNAVTANQSVNVTWEKYDQNFYSAWYLYWKIESSWKYSNEWLTKIRDYLLKKAKWN